MKRSFIAVAVLSSLFMSAGVFAAEGITEGKLTINGKVAGSTCQFLSGNENATISMSEIGVEQFKNVNVGAPVTTYTNTTSLPLKVKCTGNETPRITFSSTQFQGTESNITHNTSNDNPASGVGFAVYYGKDTSTRINGNNSIELEKSENGEYELHFTAQYAKAEDNVNIGNVSSAITMTVVTD
ncbi:fimbrial protein YehD [Escherichia coli]|nr:fimbrial protein YehD [Escherichia coli]EJM2305920.1 fimbrial protein YehD [Escherichia coli]